MCWWSTGIEHVNAPTMAATRGAHIPVAFTTISHSISPCSVRTARTAPSRTSIPVTSVWMRISTPSSRAAFATAYVAMCGSTAPSPGIHTAP